MKKATSLQVMGSLFAIAAVTALVLWQMVPPDAVPASAPSDAFSSARAFELLKTIARAPHPTGSPESALVRQFLFDYLDTLGLQPEIQTSTSVYHDTGKWGLAGARGMESPPDTWSIAGATIHNVMARIPGTDSSGAIVLSAHYDSVPYGPGAGDDGAGVAAILETARALLAGPPLRNDVILLLVDGEEIGLMGSNAFAKNHPWMAETALVLNLEARGSSGVSLMYETSPDNAWLIREYAKAARGPVTSSLATDVWRLMPNSSDLTVFLKDGKQGMNFAFSENWTDYHTTHDNLADLDERSLQHHGSNALALTRHFGNLDLTTRAAEDAIFFSVLRLGVIHYPKSWAIPLLVAATIGTLGVIGFGLRKGRLSLRGLGGGVLAVIVSAGAAALVAYLAVQGLDLIKNGELRVGMGGTYNIHLYELGLLVIYLGLSGLIYAAFQRKFRPAELAAGGLIFWFVLTAGSTFILPGGSYLFLWPLLTGLLALGLALRASQTLSIFQRIILLLPVTVGLVLFGTATYLVQLMFGVDFLPVGGVFTVLLLALAFPYLEFRSLPGAAYWAAIPIVAGLIFIVWVGSTTKYSPAQPRQNFMFYSLDADNQKAAWAASTHLPDETLAPWLGENPGTTPLENVFPGSWKELVWTQEAPVLDQPGPEMTVLEDTTEGDVRTLRLNLRSPRNAWAIMAEVNAEDAIMEGGLFGERYSREGPRDSLFFKVIDVPVDGVELVVILRARVPVTVRLADVSLTLPALGNGVIQEASSLRTGFGGGHGVDWMTLIHRQYRLDF